MLLKLVGEGGTVPIGDNVILAINNKSMPVWARLGAVGHRRGQLLRHLVAALRPTPCIGLTAEAMAVVIVKIVVLIVLLRPRRTS